MDVTDFLARPVLLYRARCARCRTVSFLISLISIGAVRRTPLETERADQMAEQLRSKLILFYRGAFFKRWRAAALTITWSLPRWAVLFVAIWWIQ